MRRLLFSFFFFFRCYNVYYRWGKRAKKKKKKHISSYSEKNMIIPVARYVEWIQPQWYEIKKICALQRFRMWSDLKEKKYTSNKEGRTIDKWKWPFWARLVHGIGMSVTIYGRCSWNVWKYVQKKKKEKEIMLF